MKTKEELHKEFEALTRPLMEFMCDNYHPHVKIIINPTGAELVEGQMATPEILDYLND